MAHIKSAHMSRENKITKLLYRCCFWCVVGGGSGVDRLGGDINWGGDTNWGRDTSRYYAKSQQQLKRIKQIPNRLTKAPKDKAKPQRLYQNFKILNKSVNWNSNNYKEKSIQQQIRTLWIRYRCKTKSFKIYKMNKRSTYHKLMISKNN